MAKQVATPETLAVNCSATAALLAALRGAGILPDSLDEFERLVISASEVPTVAVLLCDKLVARPEQPGLRSFGSISGVQ